MEVGESPFVSQDPGSTIVWSHRLTLGVDLLARYRGLRCWHGGCGDGGARGHVYVRGMCSGQTALPLSHVSSSFMLLGPPLLLQAMDFPTMMQTTPYLAANGTFDADGRVDLVLGAGVMQSYMDNYYGWQLGTNIAVTHVRHVHPRGVPQRVRTQHPDGTSSYADSWGFLRSTDVVQHGGLGAGVED